MLEKDFEDRMMEISIATSQGELLEVSDLINALVKDCVSFSNSNPTEAKRMSWWRDSGHLSVSLRLYIIKENRNRITRLESL